jgi:hypothetical protein
MAPISSLRGVRTFIFSCPDELEPQVPVNAPVPFGPERRFRKSEKTTLEWDPVPHKANCCGQRTTPNYAQRPSDKSIRQLCIERFRTREPSRPIHLHPEPAKAPTV